MGHVVERSIGIEHVTSTTARSLKAAIAYLDCRGKVTMRLIICKLALISVVKKHIQTASLFCVVASVVNTVGASPKRCAILQDKRAVIIAQAVRNGEIASGRGLNQQTSLKRHGDTSWGSHYAYLCPDDSFIAFDKRNLIELAKYYPKDFSVVELMVLENQLETYIIDMRSSEDFTRLKGISALAQKMVKNLLLIVGFTTEDVYGRGPDVNTTMR
ncbi:uncharacterized protein LOC112094463 [Morus notabilis]|uniref:uncharacterized protein LOC112094463 n=1 Tax=Morus notabilis TaxID=981085 RepID=UPI000CED6A7C|nr:uncharacterized protein LOC112094463 [Morus notabilis]